MPEAWEVERDLVELSEAMTAPRDRECLSCYLARMLEQFGCAGHRFTRRWARSRLRGTEDGLVRWAQRNGGCCCDCEVVMNTLWHESAARQRQGVLCDAALAVLSTAHAGDTEQSTKACSGVAGGRPSRGPAGSRRRAQADARSTRSGEPGSGHPGSGHPGSGHPGGGAGR